MPKKPKAGDVEFVETLSDPIMRMKRSVDANYAKWETQKRREALEDFIYEIFRGFSFDHGKLVFDKTALMRVMVPLDSWQEITANEIRQWANANHPPGWLKRENIKSFRTGNKSPKQIKDELKRFLSWGKNELKPRKNVIPAMPRFQNFINSKPWRTLSRAQSENTAIRTKKV